MSLDIVTYALAKKYADKEIAEKVSSVFDFKGSVETYNDLEAYSATAKVGDTYDVLDEGGQNYAWTGSTWDSLGVNQDATNERKGLIKLSNNTFLNTTFDGNTTFTSGEITSTLEKAFEDLFGERIDFSKGVEKLSNLSTYDGWLFDNMNQDQPFFDITDGVISTIVPANGSASPNYSSQVVYKPITLTANKYYTAEVTIKSSVARRFQLLVQSDGSAGGDWSTINEESIFEVEANETYTFLILFRATSVTNPYLFGLMCGHIEGDPATVDASSVEISGFSLKEYATSPILNIETIKQYVDTQDNEIKDSISTLEPYFDDDNMAVYIRKGAIFNDNNYSVWIADYYTTSVLPPAEEEVF